tara:strand:+ start:169 stop:432 length:264 start_codon:yes stop_codon:yes gene_type:complete
VHEKNEKKKEKSNKGIREDSPMAKKKKKQGVLEQSAAQSGLRRKAHFESGGSTKEWNGGQAIHTNRADRRQTRRTRKKRAIKDSQEG